MSDLYTTFHVVPSLHPRYGGPARTVPQLVHHLHQTGTHQVITQRFNADPVTVDHTFDFTTKFLSSKSRRLLQSGLLIKRYLQRLPNDLRPDIIHSHGIWHPFNHWAASYARLNGIPLVIHTRGMLQPWSLNKHKLKKQFGMIFYQRKDIINSSLLIATSELEYVAIRQSGFHNPVAIIPNGTSFPSGKITCLHERKKVVLFVSRVHPKKGLVDLLKAWSIVSDPQWHLIVAGPDECNHLSKLVKLTSELSIDNSVSFIGEIPDSEKFDLYQQARVFVLPTYSENFGVVVAEALASGLPVITSKEAPWSGLLTHDCGWWIETGVRPLVKALSTAMNLTPERWSVLSMNASNFAQSFDWHTIANQTDLSYRWLLGRAVIPDFIHFD